jgi:hypothetical protein
LVLEILLWHGVIFAAIVAGAGNRMNSRMEYRVDLLKDDGATIYGSTAFVASNNTEAIEKAKNWAALLACLTEGAWLQINLNGVGIQTLRPGEF